MCNFGPKILNLSLSLYEICSLDLSEIVLDTRHRKIGESDCFGILREVLIMSKIAEMDRFSAQNQHFSTCLEIGSLGFFWIVPDDRH